MATITSFILGRHDVKKTWRSFVLLKNSTQILLFDGIDGRKKMEDTVNKKEMYYFFQFIKIFNEFFLIYM